MNLPNQLRSLADEIEAVEESDRVQELKNLVDHYQALLAMKDREILLLKAERDARTRRPSEFKQHTDDMRKQYAENEGGKTL